MTRNANICQWDSSSQEIIAFPHILWFTWDLLQKSRFSPCAVIGRLWNRKLAVNLDTYWWIFKSIATHVRDFFWAISETLKETINTPQRCHKFLPKLRGHNSNCDGNRMCPYAPNVCLCPSPWQNICIKKRQWFLINFHLKSPHDPSPLCYHMALELPSLSSLA